MTDLDSYDYRLPLSHIAQSRAMPRESAKLMVIDRNTQSRTHAHIADLPAYILPTDVVVINNTKVFHARLGATIASYAKPLELFLVKPIDETRWLVLAKPAKKLHIHMPITIADDFVATVSEKHDDGTLVVDFHLPPATVIAKANTYGSVPVPPYIKTIPSEREYQTVYAKTVGSVAAPTAGFHLTENILAQLTQKGVTILEITLHVGLGTFLPIKSNTLESHTMHAEWAQISDTVAKEIVQAKKEKRRVIAIGTTTVRTLEGVAAQHNGSIIPWAGDINLFIKPGFQFQVVDAMLTNFHLPKSTLLVLVSTFGGHQFIMQAYQEAIERNYRFYSFGDAMLIL